jgi:predicted transcriptional regulator
MENNEAVKKRRDRLEVINAILDIAIEGAVKTRIMYRTNVNFRQFEDYIRALLDAGLVEVLQADSRRIYRTTEKGKILLNRLRETSWIFDKIEDQETTSLPIIRKGNAAYFIRR